MNSPRVNLYDSIGVSIIQIDTGDYVSCHASEVLLWLLLFIREHDKTTPVSILRYLCVVL